MNKSINTKYIAVLAVMLVFGIVCAIPTTASANYGYGYDYSYNSNYNCGGCSNSYNNSYGNGYFYSPTLLTDTTYNYNNYVRPAPVIVQQPVYVQPQIIQQPVYVQQYVQQPVYVQPVITQPVITQPVYVQTPSYNYNQQPYYNNNSYPVYQSYRNTLDIGCFADPTNSKVNQPMTWTAEVTGGIAPYTYSWTGSDGLTGSQSSVIKYYNTTGSKSAIVTVTSADGKTGVRACSNSLTVGSTYQAPKKVAVVTPVTPVAPVQPVVQSTTNLSANSLFSLSNVPWGWVAILIILVLFFTVLYMLFNRQKI